MCLVSFQSLGLGQLPSLLRLPIWESNLFHFLHSPYRQPFQRLSGLDAASKLSDPIMIGLWARSANNGFGHAALRSANAILRIPILLDPKCHSFLGYFPPFVLLPTPAHPLPPGHNPVGHSGPLGHWLPLPLFSRCRPPFFVSPSSLLVTSSLTFLSLCAPPGCHGDPM